MKRIYKFGGASIKDIEYIKNICNYLISKKDNDIVVVFSAIGKVTNMLEDLLHSYSKNSKNTFNIFKKIKEFHYKIINGLFDKGDEVYIEINNLFVELEWILEEEFQNSYSYNYDQIVSYGELLSSKILSSYLHKIGYDHKLIDARDLIRTDNNYREANINWEKTRELINSKINLGRYVTQGFIASTSENFTTTLGREGSDFTAAIIANATDTNDVTIWKDVPGIMNSDPSLFNDSKLFKKLSYNEAIELAFYGAKVLHPRTIQPLMNKNIPLYVKSFLNPNMPGTLVHKETNKKITTSYIVKENQVLISISDPKLSFIIEEHLSQIFSFLALYSIRVNMMQNSAISFSICVDNDKYKVPLLINDLKVFFKTSYNEHLSLYTIRNYKNVDLAKFLNNKQVLLEQKSRNTMQVIAFG